jgi:hypothetical protein
LQGVTGGDGFNFGGVQVSSEPWELTVSPSRYDDYNWYSDDLPVRRFYLFIAEIGRRLRHLMTDPGPIKMIDLCEQCAEGQITEDELCDLSDENRPGETGRSYALDVADNLYWWVPDRYKVYTRSVFYAAHVFAIQAAIEDGQLSAQADYYEEGQAVLEQPVFAAIRDGTALEWGAIVRDICGPNPFQARSFDPRWRTPSVMDISRSIYDKRVFATMSILGDALEDAGCDDATVLAHCRGSGPHVRGCWVVDLVLDKR